MTPKTSAYIANRAAGMAGEQAAVAAGYSPASAGITAARLERSTEIREAIAAARVKPDPESEHFETAQEYLAAVVAGRVVADPVRVSAARALLPFERAKQRAPIKSEKPADLHRQSEKDAERAQLDAWERRTADIRARAKGRNKP